MPLGLQKRHDFLKTLAALQVSIHDDIRFAAALFGHVSHNLGDLGINCFS